MTCPSLQVTPFSRWERELPKLVGDARYKAIDKPKERRQIFDDFCRNVAEEQRLSKARKEQQAAAAQPAFLSLLDEAQALAHEAQQPQSPPGLWSCCPSKVFFQFVATWLLYTVFREMQVQLLYTSPADYCLFFCSKAQHDALLWEVFKSSTCAHA